MFNPFKRKQFTTEEVVTHDPNKIDFTKVIKAVAKDYEAYNGAVQLTEYQQHMLSNPLFTMEQKHQIEVGLRQGLNPMYFADPSMSPDKIRVIRRWLLDGKEEQLSKLNYKEISDDRLEEIRAWHLDNLDRELNKFDYLNMDVAVLHEAREWFNSGLGHKIRRMNLTEATSKFLREERIRLIKSKKR